MESSINEKINLKKNEPETSFTFRLRQALDRDLNEPLQNLLYPPKIMETEPGDLPVHEYSFGESGSEPGKFNQPAGIATDADDNLYVVDTLNQRIQKFNSSSALIQTFGGNEPLLQPIDLAIGVGNNIYVLDSGQNAVVVFNQTARIIKKILLPKNALPRQIAFGRDGVLLIADAAANRVLRIGTDGSFLESWTEAGMPFDTLSGVAVNKTDGTVALTLNNKNDPRVVLLNSDGTFKKTIGGSLNIDFLNYLEVDVFSNIYLVTRQQGKNSIYVLSKEGDLLTKWLEPALSSCRSCLTTDDKGNSYIALFGQKRIAKYKPDFTLDTNWNVSGLSGPFSPMCVAVDKKNNLLWVTDYETRGMFAVNLITAVVTKQVQGVAADNIAVTSAGEVLVVPSGSDYPEVRRYSAEGKFLGNLGKGFSFRNAYNLVCSYSSSEILVHNSSDWDLWRFDFQLNYQSTFNEQYNNSTGKIFHSADLIIPLKNKYFIVNQDYILRKYDAAGKEVPFGAWDQAIVRNRGTFSSPVLDSQENVYAICSNSVVKINSNGTEDMDWYNRVKYIGTGTDKRQRFDEIKLLASDGKNTVYTLARTAGAWQVWKISGDGNTFANLQMTIDCSTVRKMLVGPLGEIYLETRDSSMQQNLIKLSTSLVADTGWQTRAGSVLPSSVPGNQRQLFDMKLSSDGTLWLLFTDSGGVQLAKIQSDGTLLDRVGGKQTFTGRNLLVLPDQTGGAWVLDPDFNYTIAKLNDRLQYFSSGSWKTPSRIVNVAPLLDPDVNILQDIAYSAATGRFLMAEMYKGFARLNWHTLNATANTSTASVLAGKNYFVSPLKATFDGTGKLWVLDFADKPVVYKLNDTFKKETQATYLLPVDLGVNSSLSLSFDSFAATGRVYVSNPLLNKVYSFDGIKWDPEFVGITGINGPAGITFDHGGNLYLAETNSKQVSVIKNKTLQSLKFTGKSPFSAPSDIAISLSNNLYVLDRANGVYSLDPQGNLLWPVPAALVGKSLISITCYKPDKLLVLATTVSGIELYTLSATDGKYTPVTFATVSAANYREATCVSFTSRGEILLGGNRFVTCFDFDAVKNEVSQKWDFKEFDPFEFDNITATRPVLEVRDITVDKDGYIYFAESLLQEGGVVILSPEGKYLTCFGTYWKAAMQPVFAGGIALSPQGAIYLSEETRNRVMKFKPWAGKPLPSSLTEQEIEIVDNRYRRILPWFNQILERFDFAKRHFDDISDRIGKAAALTQAITMLEELETKHQAAHKDFMKAEEVLVNARAQLSVLGLDSNAQDHHLLKLLTARVKAEEEKLVGIRNRIAKSGNTTKFFMYQKTDFGYVDQFGINLRERFQKIDYSKAGDIWMMIPAGDHGENTVPDYIYFIRNPRYSGKKIHPPVILFEEKYRLVSAWKGAGLGEFANAINLTPGETKELVITTERKKSWEESSIYKTKSSRSFNSERDATLTRRDSFESSLHDAFQSSFTNDHSISAGNETAKGSGFNVGASAAKSAAKPNGKKGDRGSLLDKLGYSLGLSFDSSKSEARGNKTSNSNTVTDIKKMVTDEIRKTSNDVSQRNKLSFSNSSEAEAELRRKNTGEDSQLHSRTIKVENINEGKTVNYLFFQVTNRYSTQLWLEDVNLLLSTGVELIEGTGITYVKSIPAINFGELLHDKGLFTLPDREALTKMLGTALLRRYVVEAGIADNMPRIFSVSAQSLRKSPLERQHIKDLVQKSSRLAVSENERKEFYDKVMEFAKLPLTIKPLDFGEQQSSTVNSGQFYVDAQVGFNKATEHYLENRREIETDLHKALLEEHLARTRAGVFFPEIPKQTTHLNLSQQNNGN